MSNWYPITEASLEELLKGASKGPWALESNDKGEFYIYRLGSEPKRKITELPYGPVGYDMRLMSMAYELGAEVLYLRKELRKTRDKLKEENEQLG